MNIPNFKNAKTIEIMKRTIVKLVNDTFNIKINEPLKVLTCF